MRDLFLGIVLATGLLLLACTTASNLNEEGRRLWSDNKISLYDIELTGAIKNDLTKAIFFALENDATQSLNSDFNSCGVLLNRNIYEERYGMYTYKGTLSEWIEATVKDYSGLLCYTQNRFDQTKRRNVVTWKGEKPFIATPPYHSISDILYPVDMEEDVTWVLTLTFNPAHRGEIVLPDGQQLNVTIERPNIYTNWTKPKEMIVDIK